MLNIREECQFTNALLFAPRVKAKKIRIVIKFITFAILFILGLLATEQAAMVNHIAA